MIIARIMGGLGNQLFIYAAARALSLRTGRPLKLDIINGFCEDRFGRAFLLDHFPIQAVLASSEEVAPYSLSSPSLRRQRKLNRFLPLPWRNYYEERSLYDPRLTTLSPRRHHVYLEGYWQREDYFSAFSAHIRAELTPYPDLAPMPDRVADRIANSESICLHIRRKDYAHVLGEDYYAKAMTQIAATLEKPVFFVFADDPDWARIHIRPNAEVIHIEEAESPLEPITALRLMRHCRHHIIANSTFSWWAAWLAAHPGQRVVAPARWGYRAIPAAAWNIITN
jgi:hypothetical protein